MRANRGAVVRPPHVVVDPLLLALWAEVSDPPSPVAEGALHLRCGQPARHHDLVARVRRQVVEPTVRRRRGVLRPVPVVGPGGRRPGASARVRTATTAAAIAHMRGPYK